MQNKAFRPLLDWLKNELKGQISDGRFRERVVDLADRLQSSSRTGW
jgi:hypothetical protein